MKIRNANNKDVYDILKLKAELGDHLEREYLKERKIIKKLTKLKTKFPKLENIESKILLFILSGKKLKEEKKEINLDLLKNLFKTLCRELRIKCQKIDKALRELKQKKFLEIKKDKILFKIPIKDCFILRRLLRKELFVEHLSKKWKIEKGKAQFINLVAEEKGKIIGFLSGFFIKYKNYGDGWINEIIVLEKYRKKGIGTKLVKKFLEICKKNKIDYIQIEVDKENKGAIRFYKKLGFKKSELLHLSLDLEQLP